MIKIWTRSKLKGGIELFLGMSKFALRFWWSLQYSGQWQLVSRQRIDIIHVAYNSRPEKNIRFDLKSFYRETKRGLPAWSFSFFRSFVFASARALASSIPGFSIFWHSQELHSYLWLGLSMYMIWSNRTIFWFPEDEHPFSWFWSGPVQAPSSSLSSSLKILGAIAVQYCVPITRGRSHILNIFQKWPIPLLHNITLSHASYYQHANTAHWWHKW